MPYSLKWGIKKTTNKRNNQRTSMPWNGTPNNEEKSKGDGTPAFGDLEYS